MFRQLSMTILDPCMSLERIKNLGVLGVVDMRQLLLNLKPFPLWAVEHSDK